MLHTPTHLLRFHPKFLWLDETLTRYGVQLGKGGEGDEEILCYALNNPLDSCFWRCNVFFKEKLQTSVRDSWIKLWSPQILKQASMEKSKKTKLAMVMDNLIDEGILLHD